MLKMIRTLIRNGDNASALGVALGIGWFVLCAASGAVILSVAFKRMPATVGPLLPLCFASWVAVLFIGRAALGRICRKVLLLRRPPVYVPTHTKQSSAHKRSAMKSQPPNPG